MARRTNETSETTPTKKAPVRRIAETPRNSRRSRPAEAEPAVERAAYTTSESEGTSAESGPDREEIARRAYELYLRRGSRNGHDFEDWLEAERQLRGSGTR
jgi:hypothetical protein